MRNLELGSGYSPQDGYEHLDINPDQPHLEYVHDCVDMSDLFEDNTFDKVRASHLIEHLTPNDVIPALKEWLRILKPNGMLEIVCPNLESLSNQDFSKWGWEGIKVIQPHLYGGEFDTEGDRHTLIFTPKALMELLSIAGARKVFNFSNQGHCIFNIYKDGSSSLPIKDKNLKIWITGEHEVWNNNSSMKVVVESLANALEQEGIEVFVSYGPRDKKPDNPEEWIQLGMSGGTDPWVPYAPVKAYLGYSLSVGTQPQDDKIYLWTNSMNNADHMFFLYRDSLEWAETIGMKNTNKSILFHGADPDKFYKMERNRKENQPFCFYACGLTARQGGWLIGESFQKAFQNNENVSLVLHHYQDTDDYVQIQNRFEDDNRIKVVNLFGDEEYIEMLYNADCYVGASLIESYDLSVVEAMSTGLPVILPPAFGTPACFYQWLDKDIPYWSKYSTGTLLLRDIFNYPIGGGVLVPCIDSISSRMKEVYENQDEAKSRGDKGAEWVRGNQTWRHSAREILKVIRGE